MTIIGGNLKNIDYLLRGIAPIPKNKTELFESFKQKISDIDKVIIHFNSNVIDAIQKSDVIINKIPVTKDNLILAMNKIGEQSYQSGDHIDYENMLEITESKRKNPTEVQKKLFSKFLQLSLNYDDFKSIKSENSLDIKINNIKQELINNGTRFRY